MGWKDSQTVKYNLDLLLSTNLVNILILIYLNLSF